MPLMRGMGRELRRLNLNLERDRREQHRPAPEPHSYVSKPLRKFDLTTFVKAAPGMMTLFEKAVPEEFTTVDADDDGRPLVVVACPCGESPAVPQAGLLTCNCRRVFAGIGKGEVRVHRPPPMTDEEY